MPVQQNCFTAASADEDEELTSEAASKLPHCWRRHQNEPPADIAVSQSKRGKVLERLDFRVFMTAHAKLGAWLNPLSA